MTVTKPRPDQIFEEVPRQPEKKSRTTVVLAKIGAGVLVAAGAIYVFSGFFSSDSGASPETTAVTSTTLDNGNTGTTLETTPTTINPNEGPLESAALNQIYNEYAEQIATGDYVELTRDFFNTELQGSYELAFQLWLENLERAINYFDVDYLTTSFAGDRTAEATSNYRILTVDLQTHRGVRYADREMYQMELTGSFSPDPERVDANGAVGLMSIRIDSGTVPAWLSDRGGYMEGSEPDAIFRFADDGLLKVGPGN